MTVPLAITAISAGDIQSANVIDVKGVAQFSPGLYFQGQGGVGAGANDRVYNNLVFRGLNVASNIGTTAGGLLFIDGAPVTSGQVGDLVSVDHVEVLKGPQSAYFGRSTFAGAVNYITKDPSDTFGGRVQAQYGSYGSTDDSIMLEGPIVPGKLDMRLSGRYWVQGGQYTNVDNPTESLGRRNTDSFSGTLVAKPNDSLKIKLFATYFVDRDGETATAQLEPNQAPTNLGLGGVGQGTQSNLYPLVPAVGHNYWLGTVPQVPASQIGVTDILTPSIYNTLINRVGVASVAGAPAIAPYDFDPHFNPKMGLKRVDWQSDLTVSWEGTSGYNVTSTTAYHHDKYQELTNFDYLNDAPYLGTCFAGAGLGAGGSCLIPFSTPWIFLIQGESHDASEELRITSPQQGRFRWMAGGDYVANSQAFINSIGVSPVGVIAPYDPTPQIKTPSVFGGLYFDVTQALTISGEARYQWDQVSEYPVGAAKLYNDFKSFSPRVTIDYKFAENSLIYALWSRGYRPGGFNGSLEGAPAADLAQVEAQAAGAGVAYKQEELQNWELGVKSRFFDNRADIKLAAYVGKLENEQVNQTIFVNEGGTAQNVYMVIGNIGLTDLRGVEVETNFQATDKLKLSLTFADNMTDIRKYYCSLCANYITGNGDPVGNRLPNAPAVTGSISAQYNDHLRGDYDWYARIDYILTGNEFAEETNTAGTGTRQDLRARIGIQNKAFMVELWGTNLTQNKNYAGLSPDLSTLQGLNYTALNIALPLKRQFGIRSTYNF